MGTVALRVTGARKAYHGTAGDTIVFRDVDLTVSRGEIYVLLGPSGCGKSTLLRVIAGLESVTAGQVEIAPGEGAEQRARPVGVAFQDPLLLPWLTVAENVALGLRFGANRWAWTAEAIDGILGDFGLDTVRDAYPAEISGGQAQRANLGRAIVTRPRILLCDEPFGALDPRTRAAMQDWLLGIVRARGLTVVLVTHDVDEALYLGDHIGLMTRGPGTIAHVWNLRDGRDGEAERRGALREAATVRAEIMASYQSDVPIDANAPNWVI